MVVNINESGEMDSNPNLEALVAHRYRFTVEPLDGAAPLSEEGALTFEVDMHDDLARVLGMARSRPVVPEPQILPFVVGLKLFGEVFLRNRKLAPFSGLAPHFRAFMGAVKRGDRDAVSA